MSKSFFEDLVDQQDIACQSSRMMYVHSTCPCLVCTIHVFESHRHPLIVYASQSLLNQVHALCHMIPMQSVCARHTPSAA